MGRPLLVIVRRELPMALNGMQKSFKEIVMGEIFLQQEIATVFSPVQD
jgi:hypothetical protein